MTPFRLKKIAIIAGCLVLFGSVCTLAAYSDIALPDRPKWQVALAGSVAAPPQPASYGIAAILEGRQLAAISENGIILWQKSTSGRPEPFFTVTRDDFIYIVTDKTKLTLFNPSGLALWKIDNGEIITAPPKTGRDGRVFISGTASISCYGTDGAGKWKREIEHKTKNGMPLFELNDGSLLCITEKTSEGKSIALRISPYGKIIEEIIFTGIVSCGDECSGGVILCFEDGKAGCCTVGEDGTTATLWTVPVGSEKKAPLFLRCREDKMAVLHQPKQNTVFLSVYSLAGKKCRELYTAQLPMPAEKISNIYFCGNSFVVLSASGAVSYDLSGKIEWKCSFDSSGNAFQVLREFDIFTETGHLFRSNRNWTISAYRLVQIPGNFSVPFAAPRKYRRNTDVPFLSTEEISRALAGGMYAEQEQSILRSLDEIFADIFDSYTEKNTRRQDAGKNTAAADKLPEWKIAVNAAGRLSSAEYTDEIADMITAESDISFLIAAVKAAKAIAFDPEKKLLSALQHLSERAPLRDNRLYFAVCDAVFSICRYMGKPALFSAGKSILRQLSQPQFSSEVRARVLETFKAIAELETS
ncbi:MAG: hypothetical protein NC041_04095 [Bacteroides sp.]|nr:hypothetical protein [Prevotella sp.]MCM1407889.1 hypothetical protein [Treponema brennaborense]MCM1469631.1 hypothetical protein [Bacteroides sp.]